MTDSKDDALRRIADRTICDCEVVALSVMPGVTGTCRTKWPGMPAEWCIHCLAQSGLEHLEGVRSRKFQLMAKAMGHQANLRIEYVDKYERAGGDVVCQHCGLAYFEHPKAVDFLTLLCDGSLVKL